MYGREIQGQTLTFDVTGDLIKNNLVMRDRQTQSLWSQFHGSAIEGALTGTSLEHVPATVIDWGSWLEMHPDTKALDKAGQITFDPYTTYYESDKAGSLGQTSQDDRLPIKERVIGLEKDESARAYPYSLLTGTPVLNDVFEGTPIVITLDQGSSTGRTFDRRIDGRTLTFDFTGRGDSGPLVMVEHETGTIWSGISGEAIEGPMVGTVLTEVRSLVSFWFAWKDFFPHTEVYGQ